MKEQLKLYQQRLNSQLVDTLNQLKTTVPARLHEAISYATLNPGKRLRPALIYAIGEALAIPLEKLDAAAVAIELIHCYSLVHDDLPAMDDDDLRRGLPTCHKKYDEATAILVGDAQQTLAFQVLSQAEHLTAEQKLKQIQLLAQASSAIGMIGGQMIDIENEGKLPSLDALIDMHNKKTGALIQCALLMGACLHPHYAEYEPLLKQLGSAIGLAFQIQDDILDIEGDTATLGKTQGRDVILDKSTFPKLLGLEKAKTMRNQQVELAHSLHQQLEFKSPFLQKLIDYIAQRQY